MRITDAIPNTGLGPTFLTTYTLDPHILEHWLLPMLASRGSDPIFLFVDGSEGYASLLEAGERVRGAGDQYHVLRFRQPHGVFHPKVFLFAGAGTALVGSGNLTRSGLSSNLEAFCRLDAKDHPATVDEVAQFFRDLVNDDRCVATGETRTDALKYLRHPRPRRSEATAPQFVHTLEKSLFDQLGPLLAFDGESRTTLCSPFHHPEHGTAQEIQVHTGSAEVFIAASRRGQPDSPQEFPHGFISPPNTDAPIRHLHAKVYESRSHDCGWQIIGSANATAAAWRGTNIEAVVFRRWSDLAHEPEIDLSASFVEGEWDAPVIDWEPTPRDEIREWGVIEAQERDGKLLIVLDGEPDGNLRARSLAVAGPEVTLSRSGDDSWYASATEITSGVMEVWDDSGTSHRAVLHRPERLREPLVVRRFRGILDHDRTEPAPAELRLEAVRLLRRQLRAIGSSSSIIPGVPDDSAPVALPETSDAEVKELAPDEAHTARDLGVFGRVAHSVFGATRGRRLSDILGRYTRQHEYTSDSGDRSAQADRDEEREHAQAEQARRQHVVTDREVRALLNEEIEWLAGSEGRAIPLAQWRDAFNIVLRAISGLAVVADQEELSEDFDQLEFLMLRSLEIAWAIPSWGTCSPPGWLTTLPASGDASPTSADRAVLARIIEGLGARERVAAETAPTGRIHAVARGFRQCTTAADTDGSYAQDHPVFELLSRDEVDNVVDGLANAVDPWMAAYEDLGSLRSAELTLKASGAAAAVEQARAAAPSPIIRYWIRLAGRRRGPNDNRVMALRNSACSCGARIPDQIVRRLNLQPTSFHKCEACHCIVLPGPLFMKDSDRP